jgi:hypothetical protein
LIGVTVGDNVGGDVEGDAVEGETVGDCVDGCCVGFAVGEVEGFGSLVGPEVVGIDVIGFAVGFVYKIKRVLGSNEGNT